MFSRGEIRLLGLTTAIFLAGLGWRSAQARLSLSPLQASGTALEWTSEPVGDSDSGTAIPMRHARSSRTKKISGALNPNRASVDQLQPLPGIGPALASRIAQARDQSPFLDADDLLRVKGIGPVKLEKLRSHLTF